MNKPKQTPTLLGRILLKLFPKTIARLVKILELSQQARTLRWRYRYFGSNKPGDIQLENYYKLVQKFHKEKMWFMKDLPTLESSKEN